jgi:integrase
MMTDKGSRSWIVQYRHNGKVRKITLKGILPLAEARAMAMAALVKRAKGEDPAPTKRVRQAPEQTFAGVAQSYLRLDGKNLRSHLKYARTLERLVYPVIGACPIRQIERSEIVNLIDGIGEKAPIMARLTFAIVRRVMSWHAVRDDRFLNPIVAGMAPPAGEERSRILSDDELRAVWKAAQAHSGVFGHLVRFLLLTAARRNEASGMKWTELQGEVWIVPPERHKTGGKAGELVRPLSSAAMDIINGLPRISGSPYVFTTDGKRAFTGSTSAKERFDKECGVMDWTIHDLRRTARSLMSRAGVESDIAERAIGHAIGGVRAVYDRYSFLAEKRQAFEALGILIDRIVTGQGDNVVQLRAG